jgi:hypothetical protein
MRKTFLAGALIAWTTSTSGAEQHKSFAAAQAPEQAFEVCFAETAENAAACAMKKCQTGGASECAVMAACAPGWAGTMGVRLDEVHFTETICGAPSKQAVLDALRVFCKGRKPYVRECFLASVWSPEGKETKVEKTIDPAKLK